MPDQIEALLKRVSKRQIKLLRAIPRHVPKYATVIYRDAKLTYREGELWRLMNAKLIASVRDEHDSHSLGACITDLGIKVLEEYKRRNP